MNDEARQTAPCPDDILSQCAALMARQGYAGTSMRDLARTTGRSLSGLYHYFANKEELLFLINQRGFSSLLDNAERLQADYHARSGKASPQEASAGLLRDLIGAHLDYFGSHLNEMRVLMFGTAPMSSAHGEIIRQLKNRYGWLMHFAVERYLAARGWQPGEKVIERKTYLLFGMMNWIFGWYSYDEHGSAEDLAEEVFATFTQGCMAGRTGRAGDD